MIKLVIIFLQTYLGDGMPEVRALISSGKETDKSMAKSLIQSNFAKVEVYFQTLNVINIKQSIAINVSTEIHSFLGREASLLAYLLF